MPWLAGLSAAVYWICTTDHRVSFYKTVMAHTKDDKFELLGQPFTTSYPLRGSHCTWISISSHLFLLNNGRKKPHICSQMNAERPSVTWSKCLITNHRGDYQSRLQMCDKWPRTDQKNSMKCWEGEKQIQEAFLKQKIRFLTSSQVSHGRAHLQTEC